MEFSEKYLKARQEKIDEFARCLDAHEEARIKREVERKKREEENKKFHDSLIKEAAFTHPGMCNEQYELAFNKAYERGHSYGYDEVKIYYDDILDLFEEFKRLEAIWQVSKRK